MQGSSNWTAMADIGVNPGNKAQWQALECVLVNLNQYLPCCSVITLISSNNTLFHSQSALEVKLVYIKLCLY